MFKKALLIAAVLLSTGCNTRHEVQMAPVEVKPIHITIDVNVKIEKELDDFFGDIDKAEESIDETTKND